MPDAADERIVKHVAIDAVPERRTVAFVVTDPVDAHAVVLTRLRFALVRTVELALIPRRSSGAQTCEPVLDRMTCTTVLTRVAVAECMLKLTFVSRKTLRKKRKTVNGK